MAFFVCPYKITFLLVILKFEGVLTLIFEKRAKRKRPTFREPSFFEELFLRCAGDIEEGNDIISGNAREAAISSIAIELSSDCVTV